jgi:hypothetical protein
MALTRTLGVDDDGSGGTGTVINTAWKTELYNQIDAALLLAAGAWVTPAYSGGNFTANGSMTWTVDAGDVASYRYVKHGSTVFINIYLITTTVGGTPNSELRIALPAGVTPIAPVLVPCVLNNNSGTIAEAGQMYVAAGGTYIGIGRLGGLNFSASAGLTYVFGQIAIQV